MHSMIRHSTFPLLLLLLCFSVAASNNAFVPRKQRRYLSEASSRPSIDLSSQSLHQRDAILPFGLQVRGGDLDEDVIASEAVENEEEAMDEAAESDGTATKVWEEEIKRTRSFYQEQSVDNEDEADVNNVQDEHSDESPAASDLKALSTEEGDDSEPAQADEDIVDVVEVKADTEDNTEVVEEVNQVGEEVITQVDATDNESGAEVIEEAQEEVVEATEEALQVEVDAEEQSSESGEVGAVGAEESIASEKDEGVEVSDETVIGEVVGGEEVVAGEIADEVEEVSEGDHTGDEQSTAKEESADSDEIVDTSDTPGVAADDEVVAEENADDATNDESSEYTLEQDDASSVAVTDESTSLVTKARALAQVMLLRGRIAVSKNKGVQYLAQNKPKIKVIALASLGGVLSLLVGGHVFLAMQQEADRLEVPNNEWIEEDSHVDESEDDDNDY